MTRVLTSAVLVWAGTAAVLAQAVKPAPAKAPVPAAGQATASRAEASPAQAAEAAKHAAWVKKNCVGCHNGRTAQPPDSPVNLESASFDDVLANAETWERVLRKL